MMSESVQKLLIYLLRGRYLHTHLSHYVLWVLSTVLPSPEKVWKAVSQRPEAGDQKKGKEINPISTNPIHSSSIFLSLLVNHPYLHNINTLPFFPFKILTFPFLRLSSTPSECNCLLVLHTETYLGDPSSKGLNLQEWVTHLLSYGGTWLMV